MNICRKTGKIPINATYFHSWSTLADEISVKRDELVTRCVFSDLRLGAWKGHWIGREIHEQLGLAFPEQRQPRIGLRPQQVNESQYIGDLTDNEGRGDFNTLLSHQLASESLDRIKELGLRWIIVLAPAAPETWGHENVQLINFLAQGCGDAGCDLLLVFTGDAASARECERWDLHWRNDPPMAAPASGSRATALGAIPGVIPPQLVDGNGVVPPDALTLTDGRLVLSPLSRRGAHEPARELLTDFLNGEGSLEYQWLAAYAFADDVADDDEVGVLFSSASYRSAEGGDDVVLKLLALAKRKTSDLHLLGWADAQTQSSVLRLRRWEDAIKGPLPAEGLHESLKILLLQSKAWGLVMTNRAVEAEPYFQATRDLMIARQDSKFYLYLLNTSALNKLRIGDFDTALELEKIIERRLAMEVPTDWHATYINSINQARLYKKAKDLETWEAYYEKAFSITERLRSESDLLYTCFCYAQLEERKGRNDEALQHWIRASIHWLSSSVPESLAPRVVEAIMQGPQSEFMEAVSLRLHENLKAAWIRAGRDPGAVQDSDRGERVRQPSFTRIEAVKQPQVRCALGSHGWSVFLGHEPSPPRFLGDEYRRLSWCVWELLRVASGVEDLPETCAILTDSQFGSDLPRTIEETIDCSIRVGVRTVIFENKRTVFNDEEVKNLRARTRVGIAPGVAAVGAKGDRLVVSYKRYLKPLVLAPHEAEIVRLVTEDCTVESLSVQLAATRSHDEVLGALADLERKRVVRLGSPARASA